MSRQEDFIDAGIAYRMEHSKPMCIAGSNLADVERDFNRVISFEAGAEHGYQYAVDKACEWLKTNAYDYTRLEYLPDSDYPQADVDVYKMVKDLRKAMEE